MDDNAYQSSEIFLSMVQKEYESEQERSNALDSKIAFSLPVIATYFFILAQDANIRKLWPFIMEAGYSTADVRQFMSLLLCVIAVLTAFASLFWMIHITLTLSFQELNIISSKNARVMSMNPKLFSARIAMAYLRQIKKSRKANRAKSNEYHISWTFGMISLSCFLLYTAIVQ